jgi:hypothetical protein
MSVATMTNRDRIIHAPEFQTGMNRHTDRPLCYREVDDGESVCACCATPELHEVHITHTEGCTLCARGQRAAMLYWTYAR